MQYFLYLYSWKNSKSCGPCFACVAKFSSRNDNVILPTRQTQITNRHINFTLLAFFILRNKVLSQASNPTSHPPSRLVIRDLDLAPWPCDVKAVSVRLLGLLHAARNLPCTAGLVSAWRSAMSSCTADYRWLKHDLDHGPWPCDVTTVSVRLLLVQPTSLQ